MKRGVSEERLRQRQLQALGDPVRHRILELLKRRGCCSCQNVSKRDPGMCVCDFERVLGLRQPTITHHVRRLREAGLIETQKIGRWLYCCRKEKALDGLAKWLRDL